MNRKKKLMRETVNENKEFTKNKIKNSIFTQPVKPGAIESARDKGR
jgi:hypothetical protein